MLEGRIKEGVRQISINEIQLMSLMIVMFQPVNPAEPLSF